MPIKPKSFFREATFCVSFIGTTSRPIDAVGFGRDLEFRVQCIGFR